MVHSTTISEYQRVMLWKLKVEDFGTKTQHIYEVENILYDTIRILNSVENDLEDPNTFQDQPHLNKLFETRQDNNHKQGFDPRYILSTDIKKSEEKKPNN